MYNKVMCFQVKRVQGLLALLLLPVVAAADSSSQATPTAQAQSSVQTPVPLNCTLPIRAPQPDGSLTAFADFSWLQFIALNWPASKERGVPDCTVTLGSADNTVWQTYKTTDQLFLDDAVKPEPWSSGALMAFTLEHRAKAPVGLPVEESVRQAVGGWLTDQQGNPTYYSISVNRVSYDYVVDNGYYNADTIAAADSVNFPDGALEVKAAWRILTEVDDHSRYHTMTAQVTQYDDQGNNTGLTREALVGMVGMHVVYRAPGFPQWTWATFEQVDNTDASHGVKPSYFNENCSGPHCTPNVSPLVTGAPFTAPNQVSRVTDLEDEVIAVNQNWQARVAGTAFQYYRLISPQWPADPNDPGNPQGSPTPGTVANTVLESYIQPVSSCMDCHSTARVPGGASKSNYSFIFLFAQQPAKAQGESQ